jgi:hypothetical protein
MSSVAVEALRRTVAGKPDDPRLLTLAAELSASALPTGTGP